MMNIYYKPLWEGLNQEEELRLINNLSIRANIKNNLKLQINEEILFKFMI